VALLLPPVAVPTGEAYGWVAADRGAFAPAARRLSAAQLADWAGVVALAGNDFEGPVVARVPAVASLAAARSLFTPPLPTGVVPPIYQMSGSGSTWFVLVADHRVSLDVSESETWRTIWTETVDRVAPVEPLP
jgi:4-diphosphocytidyl-2C-methyl-D-erythritol kinase